MSLSKQAIDEFKTLYRRTYGVILSDTEARIRANNLMNVYRSVYLTDERCDDNDDEQSQESA